MHNNIEHTYEGNPAQDEAIANSAATMPTVDDFETENGLPNPEVTKHYKIDVQ
ncbi:MAG: hypothetical protein GY833_10135 [Aestuariibacter sp.]|nr:hypothetical protein [Aestuariibacter sp.]